MRAAVAEAAFGGRWAYPGGLCAQAEGKSGGKDEK